MQDAAAAQVFFEPKVAAHAPELYAHDGIASGIPAVAAGDPAAAAEFDRDGFLLIRGLIDAAEIEAAWRDLDRLTRTDAPACSMIWYEGLIRDHLALEAARDRDLDGRSEGGFAIGQEGDGLPAVAPALRARLVRKLMGFVDRNPGLAALARHQALLTIISQRIGAAPRLFQDMALIKPPGGREKPWHQDHAYFNLPLDTPIVGVWIPLGTATVANGCMHVLAGGHRDGPRPHFQRRDWQLCDDHVETGTRLAVPMVAGDVLLFDGKLPHGTPTNHTDDQRWAVQFHYRPVTSEEVAESVRLDAFGNEGKDVTC